MLVIWNFEPEITCDDVTLLLKRSPAPLFTALLEMPTALHRSSIYVSLPGVCRQLPMASQRLCPTSGSQRLTCDELAASPRLIATLPAMGRTHSQLISASHCTTSLRDNSNVPCIMLGLSCRSAPQEPGEYSAGSWRR